MKVYVANTTQQVQDFVYRMVGTRTPRRQTIEIGSQVQLSGDFTSEDIDYLVEQHARYGLVAVDEIDRTRAFVGTCYSVGKPVPIERIRIALTTNETVLIARGIENRQQAAVALNNMLEQQAPGLQRVEFTVQEEAASPDSTTLAEGIRVSRNAPQNAPPTPASGSRRRKAA